MYLSQRLCEDFIKPVKMFKPRPCILAISDRGSNDRRGNVVITEEVTVLFLVLSVTRLQREIRCGHSQSHFSLGTADLSHVFVLFSEQPLPAARRGAPCSLHRESAHDKRRAVGNSRAHGESW